MSTQITVTHERVDDLPAIITHLKKMRVAELLNNHFPPNGNWQGLSLGGTRCLGRQVKPRDLTDDRLATTLDYLGAADRWVAFERELNQSVLRVYDLQGRMVRVDTTTAATYVTPEGLFQLGHSKDHRPDLPQVKIAMAVLDPLGLPLTTTVVAGQTADDPLYLPEIAKVRQVADPTVSAGRTAGRRVGLPVEHRAARVGVDAIRRAAQSAASRRHA
jgi:transposase